VGEDSGEEVRGEEWVRNFDENAGARRAVEFRDSEVAGDETAAEKTHSQVTSSPKVAGVLSMKRSLDTKGFTLVI
jgi:hypothetical protein